MSEYTQRLSNMKDAYDESQNQYDSMFRGVKIPAANYLARLQSAKVTESKSSGKLMVSREHIITDGEYKGMVVYDNIMLETPMGFTFARRWFDMMGYNQPENPKEIPDLVEEMANEAPDVKIRIKHSGDFINVSVIEVIGEGSGEDTGEDTGTDTGEDKGESELLERLRAFCISEEIEVLDEDDEEILKEKIDGFQYPDESLTDEKRELLIEIGQEKNIQKKKQAPPKSQKSGKKKGGSHKKK